MGAVLGLIQVGESLVKEPSDCDGKSSFTWAEFQEFMYAEALRLLQVITYRGMSDPRENRTYQALQEMSMAGA